MKHANGHSTRWLLRRASQVAEQAFGSRNGDHREGLTPRQFDILVAVAEHEPCSQTRIVAVASIDRSTLADVVGKLVKRGLLKRRRTKEDAREYAVELTAEGRKVLAKGQATESRAEDVVLSGIAAAGIEKLRGMLTTIAERGTSP